MFMATLYQDKPLEVEKVANPLILRILNPKRSKRPIRNTKENDAYLLDFLPILRSTIGRHVEAFEQSQARYLRQNGQTDDSDLALPRQR
jgi:hypothetical protein